MREAQKKETAANDKTPDPAGRGLAARLLPVMARRKATQRLPEQAGASSFYEMEGGWETRVLLEDADVYKVYTTLDLEDAFLDTRVRTVFIPRSATVSKNVALRICGRHGQGKTVFFESGEK